MGPKLIKPNKEIILSDEARAEIAAAAEQSIEGYLVGLSQQVSIYNENLDLVLKEALRERGMPVDEEGAQALVIDSAALARAITVHKLRNYHLQVKSLVAEMSVKAIPPATLWIARRVGVDLLEAPEPH